ncbi:uncharacterized protein LOC115078497 [Rhinatrema bivittatum]|uniref:uncharacterized protein LOC115078497 n=1 Tax=Rhinatrema bivittatum TaxID=194408 RepID=UPI0011283948|nr:uncharacterized protein LOC115078497 [Rhinatrema bivittatum]
MLYAPAGQKSSCHSPWRHYPSVTSGHCADLDSGFNYSQLKASCISVDKTPPSVFPLIPCRDTPSSTTEMTIGCLIRDFLPQPVDIQWNSGSVRDNIKNFPATLGRQSGLYTRSSQLTVKTSEWESQAYECNVEHKPTNTKITKRIVQLPEHTTPKEPTVKVLQSSCDDRSHELVCMISQFSPETITVQWLLNGQVKALSPITSPPAKGSDGTFTSHSQVNIPKEQMNYKDTYTCQVHHPATKTSPKDSIQTCCSECGTSPQPTVTIIPPSVKDLYVTKQPKITCLVTQMLSTKNLEITWSHKRGESSDITITDPDYQIDGTISISSTLNVSPEEWETGDKMSCTVTHADLPSPVVKSISKGPDEGSAPIVYTFPPSQQELSLYETVTLTCLVMQFSPSPIFIRWKRRGRVLSEDAYVSTEPTKEKDRNEFFLYSKLTVQKSDWNNRDVFTCVVFHSALHSKSTEQNIQKPSGSCSCKGNRRRQLALWSYEPECYSEDDGEEESDNLWTTAGTFIVLFLLSVFYSAIITLVKRAGCSTGRRDTQECAKAGAVLQECTRQQREPPPGEIWQDCAERAEGTTGRRDTQKCAERAEGTTRRRDTQKCAERAEGSTGRRDTQKCAERAEGTTGRRDTQKCAERAEGTTGRRDTQKCAERAEGSTGRRDTQKCAERAEGTTRRRDTQKCAERAEGSTGRRDTQKCAERAEGTTGRRDTQKCAERAEGSTGRRDTQKFEFAPPQVFPLIPCVFPSGDTVTVGCLVSQFFPTPVSVQWTEGAMNLTSNVKTFPAALDSSNSSYTLSSELTIPVSEWKTNSLSCSVSHSFTNTNTTVHLGPRSKPVIRLLQETCPEQDGSGFVRFLCLASNLSSPDVELDWYKGDVLLPASVKYSVTQKQGQYMLLSTQNVSQGDWNSGAIITCRAKDSTGIKAEATISKCSDGLNCLRIDVFLLPPTPEDLLINKRPKVGCLASNLPKNSGYSFTWNRQKSGEKVIITEDAVQHNNGSYSVTSYLEICNEDWESSEPFTCTMEYPGLTAPIVKTIFKKKNIIPLPPVVSVFSPTPEELAQGEMVCCTCLVKSFLPSEIFLKWTEGDEEMDLQAYSTTPPQYEEFNESYFVYSKMCVSYSDWNQGKSYACVVGHEALPMYLTQRSLDKFSGKPTYVNVSVIMSDSTMSCP